ncbi:hypothetical protein O181_099979 [Austropuccinia psidii MF-1]|uniref:Uncharacterized protein n=1 Tax=Austropuccinia psidii MF-1 TaxID=1389203 RepID=A0A9Q3JDR0_9BASI|nr:hypothetical protein [Austropuccinia psidii MF-1]
MMKRSIPSNPEVIMEADANVAANFLAPIKQSGGPPTKARPQFNARSEEPILSHITLDKPCFLCFEWGWWKQDCPVFLGRQAEVF